MTESSSSVPAGSRDSTAPARERRWRGALHCTAAVSALLYALLALGFGAAGGPAVWRFLACFAALFGLYGGAILAARRGRAATTPVLLWALLFRLLLVPAGLPPERMAAALAGELAGAEPAYRTFLLYDNDAWRYLWDGHLTARGVSPYRWAPAELGAQAAEGREPGASLLSDERWWDVLDNVSFQGHRTVYPPAAQALFAVAHVLGPGSIVVWKLLVALLDWGTCWLVAALLGTLGRHRGMALLYAWNPLAVKELAGSGHADALAILLITATLLLAARRAHGAAAATLGVAALAKWSPLALAPLLLRHLPPRRWIWLPAVVAAGLLAWRRDLPALAGGLAVYSREWVFNPGAWAAVAGLARAAGAADPAALAHVVTRAATVALLLALAWRRRSSARGFVLAAFWSLAAVALLSPAVMPWYLLWALPAAAAAGVGWWPVATALVMLSYLHYVDQTEPALRLWLEHGAIAAVALFELARRPEVRPWYRGDASLP